MGWYMLYQECKVFFLSRNLILCYIEIIYCTDTVFIFKVVVLQLLLTSTHKNMFYCDECCMSNFVVLCHLFSLFILKVYLHTGNMIKIWDWPHLRRNTGFFLSSMMPCQNIGQAVIIVMCNSHNVMLYFTDLAL